MDTKWSEGRAKIKFGQSDISIEIPARRNWFMIVFMMAWLGGWIIGEGYALCYLISAVGDGGSAYFVFFWCLGWTIGGLAVFSQLIWQLAGKECIDLNGHKLSIGNCVLGFGSKREYSVHHIRHLAVHDRGDDHDDDYGFGSVDKKVSGRLKFDYGHQTIRFARDIDEAEAKILLQYFFTTNKFSKAKNRNLMIMQKQL